MQCVYLDITTEQCLHNRVLQSHLPDMEQDCAIERKYRRVYLHQDADGDVEQLLVQMTIEEAVHWILRRRKYLILQLSEPETFYTLFWARVQSIRPQLELFVYHDIELFCARHNRHSSFNWNMEGYLLFSAKKLKWMLETIVQDVYQICRDEQEREEFIALLQFCAAAQQSLLDDVYITLETEKFTMVDAWGNDLQQIYLETLPAEEYEDVQMHDLLLSILMTMLPKKIHLFVAEEPTVPEEQMTRQNLLQLLDRIFGDRICLENEL